ncbi:class I SAM-dependent methyltransferase [Marinomonas flavescens]|uniref:class I SAM-dependent methyltransferase n=1 Tax=Marinomonas flavescens TaxID=2529379 RepID=UPI001055FD2F|nr:methyltransferase domain-containing protein [Marinomonas flavescens]
MQIEIWGLNLNVYSLNDFQLSYLQSLPQSLPTVDWVWAEMDRIWDDCSLDNLKPFSEQNIGSFYGHPVWIMNGLFTEKDKESKNHRKLLAAYLNEKSLFNIADYGGGSGVLAEQIVSSISKSKVDIVEPYATEFFKQKLSHHTNVSFVSNYSSVSYDCIIAQDVLEHVENPVEIAFDMASHVKEGGYVIFANCFYPVIKCHLPSTFFLRHTFKKVMSKMGLTYIGSVSGVGHALIFQKNHSLDLEKSLCCAKKLRFAGLLLNKVDLVVSKVKRLLK